MFAQAFYVGRGAKEKRLPRRQNRFDLEPVECHLLFIQFLNQRPSSPTQPDFSSPCSISGEISNRTGRHLRKRAHPEQALCVAEGMSAHTLIVACQYRHQPAGLRGNDFASTPRAQMHTAIAIRELPVARGIPFLQINGRSRIDQLPNGGRQLGARMPTRSPFSAKFRRRFGGNDCSSTSFQSAWSRRVSMTGCRTNATSREMLSGASRATGNKGVPSASGLFHRAQPAARQAKTQRK